jgi:hypothetical protein
MQTISITDLYDLLSQKLGKKEAKTLVDFVEAKIENTMNEKARYLATKRDVSEAKSDIIKWMFGTFIAIVIMILGLYATIIFK